jgi:cytochrome P450
LDEAPHAEQRRVLVPPFHGERMRAHIGRMRDATLDSMARWPVGRPFEIEERMREITLRSILEVVLGLDFEAERNLAEPLRDDFVKLLSYARLPYAIVLAKLTPHRLLSRVPFWPYYRELRRINAALHEHLRRRRAALAAPTASAAPAPRVGRDDVLDELLRAKHGDGAPLDDGEIRDAHAVIRDQLMTMLVAGHDTTSVALAWVFLMVLERPAVVAKLREELARVTGGAPVAAEHLPRLEYLDAVIRESLRLCTIVVFVNRLTKQPFRADGHDYPAGVHLCPCIHLVHQDPTLYPEPKLFRPERFLERKFGPHEWLPFGGSDRLCIGMAFAMTQMKVVLATVFARARLARPSGAQSHRVRRGVLVAPSDGTAVVMEANGAR